MKALFQYRHIGISKNDKALMLETIGVKSLEELIDQTIPVNIRLSETIELPEAMTERQYAEHIAELASKNQLFTSYIGQGWYDNVTPAVILRNIFENPSWYTSYTPYQAEISQGCLESEKSFATYCGSARRHVCICRHLSFNELWIAHTRWCRNSYGNRYRICNRHTLLTWK